MINLTRVDHRLIHGQVAFSWLKFLNTDCILIASDDLQKDELKMAGLRMAKPSTVKLVMKGVDDSADALNSGVTDKYNLMILCESVEDVYRLAQKTDKIKSINIGGVKNADGRREISKAVYLSDKETDMIKEMVNKGMEVFVQLVPDSPSTDIMKLL